MACSCAKTLSKLPSISLQRSGGKLSVRSLTILQVPVCSPRSLHSLLTSVPQSARAALIFSRVAGTSSRATLQVSADKTPAAFFAWLQAAD